jgi:hypothetical protein
MDPHDLATTALVGPPSSSTPFWKVMVEGWRQDQLALASSTWTPQRAYYLQPVAPPTPPSLCWGASMGEVSMTTLTYNAANVWPPSTTATATYSCFHLKMPQAPEATSSSSPPSPIPVPIKANTPSGGMSSMTSRKTVKKPKFPPLKLKKKRHPSSGWRYVMAEEWAQRQMMEEEFSIIAMGQTHLGPHSAQHAVPYPQLSQASTTTRDTTMPPFAFLPLTDEA